MNMIFSWQNNENHRIPCVASSPDWNWQGFGLVAQTAPEYGKTMKREDLTRDIHGLELELALLEDQYGLLSSDFYRGYRAGELEQTRDFIRWAGYYEAKLERETRIIGLTPK